MKRIVQMVLTATLAIALVLGLFQAVTGDSFFGPARDCVGWNCHSTASAVHASFAVGQTAFAIHLPPMFHINVGWNT
jgi:hypothetical protein